MNYKLVPHESGKYTVEFDNGGCRPATDVEVALFKQRDELLAALIYHQEQTRPIQQTVDTIASVKEKNCG